MIRSVLFVAILCVFGLGLVRGQTCDQAATVSVGLTSFSNIGSTGNYSTLCSVGTETSSVWFMFPLNAFVLQSPTYAITNATITVSAGFVFTVYSASGNCSGLTLVACSQNQSTSFTSGAYTSVLYIQVASISNTQANGILGLNLVPLSPNNQVCPGAFQALPGSNNISSIGSVSSYPEIRNCGSYDYYPSWFYYDPVGLGQISIIVTNFSVQSDSLLNVYQGTCGTNLTYVTCNDDYNGYLSGVNFYPTSTARIYFHISSYYSSQATGTFTFSQVMPDVTTAGLTTGTVPSTTGYVPSTTGAITYTPPNQFCTAAAQAFTGSNSLTSIGSVTTTTTPSYCSSNYPTWFYYDPPFRGSLNITVTYYSAIDSILNVYQGSSCSNLTYIICNDDYYGSLSSATFALTSTARIYFHIGSYSSYGRSNGTFAIATTVTTTGVAPSVTTSHLGTTGPSSYNPANQFCTAASASFLGSRSFTSVGSVTLHTSPTSCGSPYYPVWFYFDPQTLGTYTISVTAFSASDSLLNIYQGTCSSLTYVTCNDDYNGYLSQSTFTVSSYNRIYFHIGSFGSQSTGSFSINYGSSGAVTTGSNSLYPPNQVCIGAAVAYPGSNSFSASGSTTTYPPSSYCGTSYYPMWFYYDPPSAGVALIRVTSFSSSDSTLNVFTGSSCSNLVYATCNDDFGGSLLSSVNLTIYSTQRIYFFIGSYGAIAYGTFALGFVTSSSGVIGTGLGTSTTGSSGLYPPNQVCAGASRAVPGSNYLSATGSTTLHSTVTSNCGNPYYPVWFYYDPPSYGILNIRVTSYSSSDSLLNVYRGTCSSLVYATCNDDSVGLLSQVNYTITTTTRVYFNIGSFGSQSTGYFSLSFYSQSSGVLATGNAPVPSPPSQVTTAYYSGSNNQCYGAISTKNGKVTFDTSTSSYSIYSQSYGTIYNTVWYYLDPPTTKGSFTIAVESYSGVGNVYIIATTGSCGQLTEVGSGIRINVVQVTDSSRIYFALGNSAQSYSGSGAMTLAYDDNGGVPTGNTGTTAEAQSGSSMLEMNLGLILTISACLYLMF